MLISLFKDVAPPVVLAGGIVWAGANYLLIAPKIAERVVAADHLDQCRADQESLIAQAGKDAVAGLELPSIDPAQELALRQVEGLMNSPLMGWARGASQGMDRMLGIDIDGTLAAAREQVEEARRAGQQAFDRAKKRLEEKTKAQLASAGDLCTCAAGEAIEQTRTDWALFTGSLTLYVPATVSGFDREIGTVLKAGACQDREASS